MSGRSSRVSNHGNMEDSRFVYRAGLGGIPGHQRAHLMYYLHCTFSVLELDDDPTINRLRQYRKYKDLKPEQLDRLIALCLLMSPDRLQERYIFHNNYMCEDRTNRFYDTEVADMMVNCDESYIDVEGETKRCSKVMAFKMDWVDMYWTEPLQFVISEREKQLEGHRSAMCSVM